MPHVITSGKYHVKDKTVIVRKKQTEQKDGQLPSINANFNDYKNPN